MAKSTPARSQPDRRIPAFKGQPLRKMAMIEALIKSLGIVTTAARTAGIDRDTHYEWLKNDPEYKTRVEDISNVVLDFAESQLHKQILAGEVSSTIFFLKTKGKGRGYIERNEITGKDGEPLAPSYDITLKI